MPLPDNPIYALARLVTASGLCIQPVQPNVDVNPVSLAVAKDEAHKYFSPDNERLDSSIYKELTRTCLCVLPGAVVVKATIREVQDFVAEYQESKNLTFCDARDTLFYGFFKAGQTYEKVNISRWSTTSKDNDVYAISSMFRNCAIGIRSRRGATNVVKNFEYYDHDAHDVKEVEIPAIFNLRDNPSFVKTVNLMMYKSLGNHNKIRYIRGVSFGKNWKLQQSDECALDDFGLPKEWQDKIESSVGDVTQNAKEYEDVEIDEDVEIYKDDEREDAKIDEESEINEDAETDKDAEDANQRGLVHHHPELITKRSKYPTIPYKQAKDMFEEKKRKYYMQQEYTTFYANDTTLNKKQKTKLDNIQQKYKQDWDEFRTEVQVLNFDKQNSKQLQQTQAIVSLEAFNSKQWFVDNNTEICVKWLHLVRRLENALTVVDPSRVKECKDMQKYSIIQDLAGLGDLKLKKVHRNFLQKLMIHYMQKINVKVTQKVLLYVTKPLEAEYVTKYDEVCNGIQESRLTLDAFLTSFDQTEEWIRVSVQYITRQKYSQRDTWEVLFKQTPWFRAREMFRKLTGRAKTVQRETLRQTIDFRVGPYLRRLTLDEPDYQKDNNFNVAATPLGIIDGIVALTNSKAKQPMTLQVDKMVDLENSFQESIYCLCKAVCWLAKEHANLYNIYLRCNEQLWVSPPNKQSGRASLEVNVSGILPNCRITRIVKSMQNNTTPQEQQQQLLPQVQLQQLMPPSPRPQVQARMQADVVASPSRPATRASHADHISMTQVSGSVVHHGLPHANNTTTHQIESSHINAESATAPLTPVLAQPRQATLTTFFDKAPSVISGAVAVMSAFTIALLLHGVIFDPVFRQQLQSIADNVTDEFVQNSTPAQLYMLQSICAQNVGNMANGWWDVTEVSTELNMASKLFVATNEYGTTATKDGLQFSWPTHSTLISVVGAVLVSLLLACSGVHDGDQYMLLSVIITFLRLTDFTDMTLMQGATISSTIAMLTKGGKVAVDAWKGKTDARNRFVCLDAWGVAGCVENPTTEVTGIGDMTFGCAFHPARPVQTDGA